MEIIQPNPAHFCVCVNQIFDAFEAVASNWNFKTIANVN